MVAPQDDDRVFGQSEHVEGVKQAADLGVGETGGGVVAADQLPGLVRKGKGPVNLRVVTSQPCRVELYDAQGALQMVDAEGNGNLKNSGDWIGMDRDRNFAADVLPDETSGETNFMLQLDPMNWKGGESLRIRVEWLVDGKWFLAAEDQIVFGK